MRTSIKYLLTCLMILGLSADVFGQNWKKPSAKEKEEESSFSQIQKDFYEYWEPFNVVAGRYINEKGLSVKASGWKQFKRWEWYMKSHINLKTGKLEMPEYFRRPNTASESTSADRSSWTSLGPNSSAGGYAGVGRINTVAFHPTDQNTFWVGTPGGGLWKTTDNGATWAALTDQLESIGVSNVIIPSDYASSKTIYISTGDRNGFDTKSSGVYKSTDDGATWAKTPITYSPSTSSMVYHMLLDPNDDKHLIATTTSGLQETKDAGATWTSLGATDQFLKYLEFQPGSNTTLYAVADSKFYKTTDGGASWVAKLQMPGNQSRLTVSAANPNRVYIVNADSELKKIYRSDDGGETFVEVLDGATKNLLGYEPDGSDLTAGQGWYDLTIEASPVNADIIFVGGVNTWKSTDAGVTWNIANHWVGNSAQEVHADKHEIVFRSNGDMFEANDGGLYISTDGTTFVNNSNGIVNSQVYKVDVSATNIITGLQDNGSKMFNGTVWKDVNGGDGMQCLIDPTNEQIQYSSSQNGNISRTTDAWVTTFETISSNIGDGTLKGAWVTPYFLDPNDNKTIYVGYDEIWKSTDQGDTFSKISSFGVGAYMEEMAIAQSNSNYIYAYDQIGFYVTKDGGATWDNSVVLPDTDLLTDIEVDFKDPEKIWVTFGNYDANRVFQSTDAGKNWTDISAGLPLVPTLDIIQRDDHSSLQLYAGTDVGVYVKNDDQDWTLFSQGLPNIVVTDFDIRYDAVNSNDSKIIAVTYGRGTWVSKVFPDLAVPSDITLTASSINENNVVDAVVSSISTDGDPNETYTYTLIGDNTDNASFKINGAQLLAAQAFDFETKSSYTIKLKTCSSINQCYEEEFIITINDINEAPTALSLDVTNIAENQDVGTQIGQLSTTDQDANNTHTYAFESSGVDNASFSLDGNLLKSAASFDFETKASYNIKIQTCDAGNACLVKDFVITIDNVNEAPTDIGLDNLTVEENNEEGSTVGNFSVSDVDVDDTHTYQLAGTDNDNANFTIDGNVLKASAAFDFEVKESQDISVQVMDANGLSFEKSFTITITNVIESQISASSNVSFEDTPLDWMSETSVEITNTGETELSMSISVADNAFELESNSMDLSIGETKSMTIVFKPTSTQLYQSVIVFSQGDFNVGLEVTGRGAIITNVDNGMVAPDEVTVYPNPASDKVTVDLRSFGANKPNLKFVSPNGTQLQEIINTTKEEVVFNTSTYPSGVYLIQFQLKDQTMIKKVIIKKP